MNDGALKTSGNVQGVLRGHRSDAKCWGCEGGLKDEEVIIRYHIPTCTEVVDKPEGCEGAIGIWRPK
jgi:hypothetical protein